MPHGPACVGIDGAAAVGMRSQRSLALAVAGFGAALIGRAVARRRRAIDFSGKVVVITGGSRGLGLVMARAFAREGARLALIAEHEEPLARALSELARSGTEVQAIACDVRDLDAVQGAVDTI